MNHKSMLKQATPILAAVLVAGAEKQSHAVPYACDITNNAGTVSFRLNENADNVKVISSGGAVTNDLGAGAKGLTTVNLGIGSGDIKVMVTRSAPAGYTQTSSDGFQDNGVYVNKYEQPRGIVINKNPATPSFGRIYIGNGRGQADTSGTYVRTTYQGIYLLNSDDTVALDTGTFPRTAGLPFTPGNTVSPVRLTIGKDDNLLYISDFSDPTGGLMVCDLNVEANATATSAILGVGDLSYGSTTHGSVYGAVVEGSFGSSNLKIWTIDEDLSPVRSVWRYDVGAGPYPYAGSPTGPLHTMSIANYASKLVKGGSSNYLYCTQNRSSGTETDGAGVRVFTEDGVQITNSQTASREYLNDPLAADLFRNTLALDISPDGNTLVLLRGVSFGRVWLVPLTNGVFNFAGTNSFSYGLPASDSTRDIAYDAAGNLYVVSSAYSGGNGEWLRIFSKGGAGVAITGTDGTFVLGIPPTLVSVTATIPTANEQGPANGLFTLTRSGDTTVPLTVNYTIGGTATADDDYTALPGTVAFAADATSTNITVAVTNDAVAELTETVILTITGSGSYGVSTGSATVSILDNEPTEVSISLAQTEDRLLEGYSESKIGFQLTRRGLIGPAITANLGYSGTAAHGADLNGPTSAAIGANVATVTFNITSLEDELYEGPETVDASVLAGTGYNIGAPATATATIIDDDYPAGTVLFEDDFETDSSANWIANSADGWFDSAVDFAFDYSTLYVPMMPGSSTTKAMRFRLNEQVGALINAVSASPLGLSLTGDYRLKFKMWNNYNGPMFNGGSGSTMHLTTGVGTTADHANLATSAASDGIWFDVDGDGGSTFAVGDCNAYIATALQDDASGVYAAGTTDNPRSTTHPYYSLWGGIPAPAAQLANYPGQTGTAQPGNMGVAWHTVVLTKANNVVTWTIDGILIATVPADSLPDGNVFVGFEDLFNGASGVPAMSFALVDNLKVETYALPPIVITDIKIVGNNVEIYFTADANDEPSSFALRSSGLVNTGYDDVSATITEPTPGKFKAARVLDGSVQFYRIKRL